MIPDNQNRLFDWHQLISLCGQIFCLTLAQAYPKEFLFFVHALALWAASAQTSICMTLVD